VTMKLENPPIVHQYLSDLKLNRENGIFYGVSLIDNASNVPVVEYESSPKAPFLRDEPAVEYESSPKAPFLRNEAGVKGKSSPKAPFWRDDFLTASDEFVIGLIEGYFSENCTITNDCVHLHTVLGNEISLLLSRFGIFTEITDNSLTVCGKWANKLANTFSIFNNICFNESNLNSCLDSDVQNDVVLDKIIEINKVDVALYPKVYDLTVPSTLNFGLANGLHVVDTADTGYLERKLIKILEDIRVEYDGTVRNANDKIIQFVYGDNGINTEHQIDQKIPLIIANNKTVREKYTYSESEINELTKKGITTKYTSSTNEMLYNKLIGMRDQLRRIQKSYATNNIVFQESFMLPVDLNQYIVNVMSSSKRSNKTIVDPYYVVVTIKKMYESDMTKIMCYL